jgi:hypothetical protein
LTAEYGDPEVIDLTMVSAGVVEAKAVSVSVGEVVPSAVALAMLVTEPASISAWVIV